jgi:hypothetical protein
VYRAILFYLILDKVATYQIIEDEVSRYGSCRFTVAENPFLIQLTGFAFPKDSNIRRIVDAG